MRDRRREGRTAGDELRRIDARVRPGHPVKVVDLSPRGALIEGTRPLRPGARIFVHLQWDCAHTSVSARVVRCLVSALHAEDGVTYRSGLAFEEPFCRMGEATARDEYEVPRDQGVEAVRHGETLPTAEGSCPQQPEESAK
jgi:PilZ domain-containing protein